MRYPRSQYMKTTKNTMCTRCGKEMNNKTRVEQDKHEIECRRQMKL